MPSGGVSFVVEGAAMTADTRLVVNDAGKVILLGLIAGAVAGLVYGLVTM